MHRIFTQIPLVLFLAIFLLEVAAPTLAEARAGGGRSSGRTSGGYNSRRYAPPPPSSPTYRPSPGQPTGNPNGGGFMRGLAGGLAGGFLGSMLFSSMGRANGFGGGGGGIGLLEILVLAGLAFFAFRWWSRRQQAISTVGGTNFSTGYGIPEVRPLDTAPYVRSAAPMDLEEASDIFFKIQGAWTRRDLGLVKEFVGDEMTTILARDLENLKANQRVNRLENISIRGTDLTENWQEGGVDYATVRFTANLLDYTVDEKSGRVLEGSDSLPVKFEEDWTFAKGHSNWQLVGIQQVQ